MVVHRAGVLKKGSQLGLGDPATEQLTRLASFALAGPVGGGEQWVSWIAQSDMSDLLLRATTDDSMSGLYHLTAPQPVQNTELMRAYRIAVGRGFGLPTPGWMATIGAWLLGSDPGLALTGRRCVPARLEAEGYSFKVTSIADAVSAAVHHKS